MAKAFLLISASFPVTGFFIRYRIKQVYEKHKPEINCFLLIMNPFSWSAFPEYEIIIKISRCGNLKSFEGE
jgi:hypothetical protein